MSSKVIALGLQEDVTIASETRASAATCNNGGGVGGRFIYADLNQVGWQPIASVGVKVRQTATHKQPIRIGSEYV